MRSLEERVFKALMNHRGEIVTNREEACRELAKAAIEAMQGDDWWQTIDSAPKDGTKVLIYYPLCKEIEIRYWSIEGYGWVGIKTSINKPFIDDLLWQPLPAPPTSETNGEG